MSKKAIVEDISKEYEVRQEVLENLEQELVNSIIKLRKSKRLTQQEVADGAGVIRETIARIENRITSPQVNTLLKILEQFGYTIKITKINKKKEN